MSKDEVVKVIICKTCGGTGGTVRYANKKLDNCTDCEITNCRGMLGCSKKKVSNHLIHHVCSDCQGSGRLQMTFITEPYKPKEAEHCSNCVLFGNFDTCNRLGLCSKYKRK